MDYFSAKRRAHHDIAGSIPLGAFSANVKPRVNPRVCRLRYLTHQGRSPNPIAVQVVELSWLCQAYPAGRTHPGSFLFP